MHFEKVKARSVKMIKELVANTFFSIKFCRRVMRVLPRALLFGDCFYICFPVYFPSHLFVVPEEPQSQRFFVLSQVFLAPVVFFLENEELSSFLFFN